MLWLKRKIKTLLIADSLKRISAGNELHDYKLMLMSSNQKLWALHSRLEKIRSDIKSNYDSYDYGNGYYYQSMPGLDISGYRDTEERIRQLDLMERLKNKSVLDIGSNTGFILLSLSDSIARGVGVELNPYLVATGNEVKEYLGCENIDFEISSFEEYDPQDACFDVVLSLANHSTFDGNTRQTVHDYFDKISGLLNEDGVLIFESHPPQIEPKEKLGETLSIIESFFDIQEMPQVDLKGFLDRSRTYVVARKKR
jgi:cyclopropane fatty-acyl-phospholipid synthase-like methyltransferase